MKVGFKGETDIYLYANIDIGRKNILWCQELKSGHGRHDKHAQICIFFSPT